MGAAGIPQRTAVDYWVGTYAHMPQRDRLCMEWLRLVLINRPSDCNKPTPVQSGDQSILECSMR